ncbi:hypothetical protein BGZ65_002151 [Modicella reniformis]|uniref:G domain-containing protein n=1 Tax=Modicella reniformis TaxID=1440133 RepID=A0A9P6M0J9_9FUNG|nr:hypothetical protein BGZ65_002151 [Modicella reniformis]
MTQQFNQLAVSFRSLKDNMKHAAAETPAPPDLPPPPSYTQLLDYNILLLGPSQAGKSTFLESVKLYADPTYVVKKQYIGLGNKSHTQFVREEVVTTSLPIYNLYEPDEDNREFDIFRSIVGKARNGIRNLLNRDENLNLRAEKDPRSTTIRFRFFDTPGLDDTNGNDIQNIAHILPILNQAKEFHLIIVVDRHQIPMLPSQTAAFRTYFELFEELKDLVTIVHTNVPHIDQFLRTYDEKLSERLRFFNQIIGHDVPSSRIDCDLNETGPVHVCLRQNVIREILKVAMIKTPVVISKTHVCKLKMMTEVDDIVRRRYKDKLTSVRKASISQEKLNEAAQLELEIEDTKREIRIRNERIRQHDTDGLVHLYEHRLEGIWFCLMLLYKEREHILELPDQEYTIHSVREDSQGVVIENRSGGRNETHWKVKIRPITGFLRFYSYHVILSTTKRTKHRQEIENWKAELDDLNDKLERQSRRHIVMIVTAELSAGGSSETLEKLKSLEDKYSMVLEHTRARTLPIDTFMDLANAGVYQGTDIVRKSEALENFLAEKFGIEWSHR